MSKTYRKDPFNFYSKEKKTYRKTYNRQQRRENKHALKIAMEEIDLDNVLFPIYKGTEGWMTH